LTAISDQSTVTDEGKVWAALAVLAALLFLVWLVRAANAARRGRRVETLTPRFRPCQVTQACPYGATELVMDIRGGSLAIHDACKGCADRGVAHGWWIYLPEDQP
jgi:hypothetical protein